MHSMQGQPESNFNPLPRKEGDIVTVDMTTVKGISIHSLVKRETQECRGCNAAGDNFNPLPRKEGDADTLGSPCELSISIHSLVKRETGRFLRCQNIPQRISIHSLVKRETTMSQIHNTGDVISIHSLVKRETSGYVERCLII